MPNIVTKRRKQNVGVRLPAAWITQLDTLAASTGETRSDWVRWFVFHGLREYFGDKVPEFRNGHCLNPDEKAPQTKRERTKRLKAGRNRRYRDKHLEGLSGFERQRQLVRRRLFESIRVNSAGFVDCARGDPSRGEFIELGQILPSGEWLPGPSAGAVPRAMVRERVASLIEVGELSGELFTEFAAAVR